MHIESGRGATIFVCDAELGTKELLALFRLRLGFMMCGFYTTLELALRI